MVTTQLLESLITAQLLESLILLTRLVIVQYCTYPNIHMTSHTTHDSIQLICVFIHEEIRDTHIHILDVTTIYLPDVIDNYMHTLGAIQINILNSDIINNHIHIPDIINNHMQILGVIPINIHNLDVIDNHIHIPDIINNYMHILGVIPINIHNLDIIDNHIHIPHIINIYSSILQ